MSSFRAASYSLAGACLALGMGIGLSRAAEVYQQTQPGGKRDIRAAELPPLPGLYLIGNYTHVTANALADRQSNALFPDTNLKLDVGNLGLLYVLPGTLWDGRLAVDAVGGYGRNRLRITNLPAGPGGTPIKGETLGFFDPTFNVTWSRSMYDAPNPSLGPFGLPSGFSYALNLAFAAPLGAFDGNKVGSTGFGGATLSPGVAFTYRTRPIILDGTELSTHFSYNHVFKHSDSLGGFDYRDGDYVIADFALTERWKMTQFGLAGSIIRQIQDDQGSLAIPTGLRGRVKSVQIGPIVSFDLSAESGIRIKYLFNVEANNTYGTDLLSVSFFNKF